MNKSNNLSFSCGVKYKNKLYLASVEGNDLYEYDLETDELRYHNFFCEEDRLCLYRCAILYKNLAWFIPQTANNIAVVNLDTNEISYINLPYTWIEKEVSLKCTSAGIFEKHFMYIVPYDIDSLIIIDMNTMKIKSYEGVSSRDRKYIDAYYYNNHLYFIPWTTNEMMEFEIDSGKKNMLPWKWGKKQYSKALVDYEKNTVWFIPAASNQIQVYDLISQNWRSLEYHNEIQKNKAEFINSFYAQFFGNGIFIYPFEAKEIIFVNKFDFKINYYSYDNSRTDKFFLKLIDSPDICVLIEETDRIFTYNEQKDCFEPNEFVMTIDKKKSDIINKKIGYKILRGEIVKEQPLILLENYTDYLKAENNFI